MTLPNAPWRHGPGMERLLAALGAAAGETRFVGGCVRDTLLGLDASDVDLATRIAPKQVMRRLEAARIKAVPTGLAHGTVTAVIAGKPVQVTTLRRDVATDGRRATIAYTEDWREDAARRDFTINALSADPAAGEVFDYFEGLADLEAGRVRFIGDPLGRIAEDHLRILRFFRFHARFGKGAPDEAALAACEARANDLMALSRERIADELLKLLALPDPTATVALMIDRGILRPVLPEIADTRRLARTVSREVAAGREPMAIRRLAALLPARAAIANEVGARLRLSNANQKRLIGAIQPADQLPPHEAAYHFGSALAIDQLLISGEDDEAAISAVTDLARWAPPVLPIRGGAIVARGIAKGPEVARLLLLIEAKWIAEGFPDAARARQIADEFVDQALRSSQ